MPRPPRARWLALFLLLLADSRDGLAQGVLHREWTTGMAPVSWGFAVQPPVEAREVVLTAASPAVRILGARGGPGLPADWTVTVSGERQVTAAGSTVLSAGELRPAFLVVETNRSSADISTRGVLPVAWRVRLATEPGAGEAAALVEASFEPVLDLSDAVSRGLVLATLEPLSPWGPAEVTVDNPTWQPVWLDLTPGSVVRVGGEDWVVGLVRPFRMMRKQKTGRTVDAFPLVPPGARRELPRRLSFASRPGAQESLVAATAIAVRELREQSRTGARRPGRFEALEPFEFWPLVLKWAIWSETTAPPPELLVSLTGRVIDQLRAAGDAAAMDLDASEAARDVEALLSDVAALREAVGRRALPLAQEASRARFL